MPKRSGTAKVRPIRQRDTNQMAKSVINRTLELSGEREKDPAAVALGRKGGLKGGKARMALLSSDDRHALAVKAAESRWKKKRAEP